MVHTYVAIRNNKNVIAPRGLNDWFGLTPRLITKMNAADDWVMVTHDHDITVTDKSHTPDLRAYEGDEIILVVLL